MCIHIGARPRAQLLVGPEVAKVPVSRRGAPYHEDDAGEQKQGSEDRSASACHVGWSPDNVPRFKLVAAREACADPLPAAERVSLMQALLRAAGWPSEDYSCGTIA